MTAFFKSMKISFMLAAALYIVLGLVLLLWPNTTSTVICYAFGTLLLVYGGITIISFFVHDSRMGSFKFELFLGIILAALGLLFLLKPGLILTIVPLILGIYIIVDNLINLKRAVELFRLEYQRWWVSLLLSLAGIGLGFFTLFFRFEVAETLIMVIGGVFVYMGISDLWSLFKVSHLTKEQRKRAPIEIDPIDIQ